MKIMLFSRDPGGANTIIPLVGPLNSKGHKTEVYGKDVALQKYSEASITATDITKVIPEINIQNLRNFIHELFPQVVITGTSADDMTEKYLWHVCEKENIPTLAIIDQWCNYGVRFSDYGVGEMQQYRMERKPSWLPTRIATLDEFAKKEMIKQGIPEEKIEVCGQPYFEMLQTYMENKKNNTYKKSNENFVIVFASEPITSTYGENALKSLGYTEQTIFKTFLEILEPILNEVDKTVKIILRPHPKETADNLINLFDEHKNIAWEIDTKTTVWDLIEKADLVCGMSSMFLIEALIIGKPIMSIQIGLCTEDPFVLARRGIVENIQTKEYLEERLRKAIMNMDGIKNPTYEIIPNPVERIINVMEELTCQNLQ